MRACQRESAQHAGNGTVYTDQTNGIALRSCAGFFREKAGQKAFIQDQHGLNGRSLLRSRSEKRKKRQDASSQSRDESSCLRGATHVQRRMSHAALSLLLRGGCRGRLRPRSRAVFRQRLAQDSSSHGVSLCQAVCRLLMPVLRGSKAL